MYTSYNLNYELNCKMRLLTADKVLEAVIADSDDDDQDPDELIINGSDNEFSDLEVLLHC